jgi:hypothetical protein
MHRADRAVIRVLHVDAPELRQNLMEGLIQRHLVLIDQLHRRHAGDRLGHRVDAKQAVGRHCVGVGEALGAAHDELGVLARQT